MTLPLAVFPSIAATLPSVSSANLRAHAIKHSLSLLCLILAITRAYAVVGRYAVFQRDPFSQPVLFFVAKLLNCFPSLCATDYRTDQCPSTDAFYFALLGGLPPMKTLLVNLTPLAIPQNISVPLIFKVIYMRLPDIPHPSQDKNDLNYA